MFRNTVLRIIISLVISIVFSQAGMSAADDSLRIRLRGLINQATAFAERMPREKVSVHLDNTGYFRGDKIWFQCYVVDGFSNTPTRLSRTLYVELLNPRGKVIARKTLKVENGRCSGAFSLDHLPFYSGFYEIRAYTKYMLNFGETAVYSRVIPVFDAPKKAGDFSEWTLNRHPSRYPGTRPATKSGPEVSMKFFPEGGNLIAGVRGKVAFEITGKGGVPLDAVGRVMDETNGRLVAEINTLHEGRGYFEMIPENGHTYKAIISHGKGENKFNLPKVRPSGIGLNVDNLSSADSIFVTIRPADDPGVSGHCGVSVSSRGVLWSYTFVNPAEERTLRFSSSDMPSGVSVITLFGNDGHTLAERMIFIDNGGWGGVSTMIEPVGIDPSGKKMVLDLVATDAAGIPAANLPLSVAITDGDNAVDYQGGVLSDLLLMSEIKGYIRNPMQYFRDDSDSSRRNLDLLMMVQGWRCYSWEQMADIEPVASRYYPEQAIDMDGTVVSFVRGIPKPDVDVSVMIMESGVPDSLRRNFMDLLTTDSCGHFRLSYDLNGKWDLLMSVREKGKKKDHRILLDRLFSPPPRKYDRGEMVLREFGEGCVYDLASATDSDTVTVEDQSALRIQIEDSLASGSIKMNEVTVKGKRGREAEIFKARSKAVAYYDIQDELGSLADKGKVVGNDLFDILKSINPSFQRYYTGGQERIYYGTRKPLFVINYETTYEGDSLNYTLLYPEAIKSVYITQDPATMLRYAPPELFLTMFDIDQVYGCAVLIETFPEHRSPAGKGTRHQTIEGYTVPEDFQNIDSESLLDKPDIRRTLYWNPLLTTDHDGKARVEFFNNSTCRNLRIDIQGIDSDGTLYSR